VGAPHSFLQLKTSCKNLEKGGIMNKIAQRVYDLALPVAEEMGLDIWDVEYLKEAGEWYLRVYIDKAEGGIFIADCESFSKAMDPILDEADPIDGSYVFEVSSAGAERQLKRPSDFERFMGSNVEVKLYKAVEGRKNWQGKLSAYDAGKVSIDVSGLELSFEKELVASVRLRVEI